MSVNHVQKERLRLIGDCKSYYDYRDSDGNDNGDDNDMVMAMI